MVGLYLQLFLVGIQIGMIVGALMCYIVYKIMDKNNKNFM